MSEIKELIQVVKILANGAALFRVVYLILVNLHEEEKEPVKKKIRNIIKVVIIINLIFVFAYMIRGYYEI